VNFDALVEEGVISARDLDLLTWCETPQEGWDAVCAYYDDSVAAAAE
jgi:predicted Rossmann-fold nucleotide-binding protein